MKLTKKQIIKIQKILYDLNVNQVCSRLYRVLEDDLPVKVLSKFNSKNKDNFLNEVWIMLCRDGRWVGYVNENILQNIPVHDWDRKYLYEFSLPIEDLPSISENESLLKAINILKEKRNFELIIIGKGNDQRLLENYISDNGLKNRVKLIGYQKNPFKFINQADIFLLTSIFEGSPNVLVEALYLKKYVISTNCPTGPKEILKNGEYGSLVKMKNFKEIAKILINFKKNHKTKKKIINGYNSLKKFDHKVNCEKYLKLVQKYI